MPIETLDDIIDELADKLYIYGSQYSEEEMNEYGGHPSDCKCRMCFQIEMNKRIHDAIEIENKLNS